MEDNQIFQDQKENTGKPNDKKPMDTASLVLGIVTLVVSPLIPLVSYICGFIGLVLAITRRKDKRTTAALVLCIIGLICAVVSHVYAAILISKMLSA